MLTAIPVNTPAYYEYAPCYAFERENNAVSREALTVSENISAARAAREYSQALFGVKDAALSQLAQLAEECREEDWDGSGASAADEQALLLAASFIRALPDDLPLPEFATEPDGAISLDWIQGRSRIFSVSVGAGSRLAYAWIDGTDRGYGVVGFGGQRIPARLLHDLSLIAF